MARAGELAAGRYRLLNAIGAGGMGSVWLARHERIGRDVAIKFSPPCPDPSVRERFMREAHIAGEICHRNVVSVLDAGELEHENRVFLVMELLRGDTLADRMRPRHPLPLDQTLSILIDVCSGLSAAHARGIVHRDVKPENIFLADVPGEGIVPKLVDFGISQAPTRRGARPDGSDYQILGTPAYMSPEQARGDMSVDARADIWAMGVILHESIAGRTPFGASDVHGLLRAAIEDPPEPLPAWVPPKVRAIVARCLEKDRRRRYPTAKALRSDLEEALAALSTAGPPSSRIAFARTRSIPPSMPKPRAAKVQLTARLCAAAVMALVAVPLATPGRMTNAAIVYLTAPVRAAMLGASSRVHAKSEVRQGDTRELPPSKTP